MKFINTTLFQIAALLTLGTLAAHFLTFEEFKLHWLWIATAVLLCIWLIERNRLVIRTYFGGLVVLILFGIGVVNYQLRQPHSRAQHYSHRIRSNVSQYAQLKIQRELKPDRYNSKYIAKVSMIDGVSSVGQILIYLPSETNSYFQVDEELVVYAMLTPLAPPKNPYQFDYSKYLNHLGVNAKVRLDSLSIHYKRIGTPTLNGSALRFRAHLIRQLSHSGIPLDERAILQALVLGQKKDISEELLENYADAGAIHILAVSGLHVGILFLLLHFLTQWLLRIRGGRYFQSILIVTLLWGYAYTTGGSPSVIRAVTMFSFLTFAQRIGRQSFSLNNLGLSYIVLLLVQPQWLFNVGFQLSYLAVFFIIWTQPKFYQLWRPQNRIARYFWGLVTVSIAAQLGVMPLSIYYFHQFPGLFLLTNLVVIPSLGTLLFLGLLIVILSGWNILPPLLSEMYGHLLNFLNSFIAWIAGQNTYVIKEIVLTEVSTLWSYSIIIALILLWSNFRPKVMIATLMIVTMGVAVLFYERNRWNDHELIVFHSIKTSSLGIRSQYDFELLTNDTLVSKDYYPIKGVRERIPLRSYHQRKLPDIFRYQDSTILIMDSLGIYPIYKKVDIVLLSHSPRIHFDRFIQDIKPRIVIADGSNYHSYVERWAQSCKENNIPFHHTYKNGAYILDSRKINK